MSTLHNRILADATSALKSGEKEKLQVLRMLKANLSNKAIEAKVGFLPDVDVIAILRKNVKTREESAAAFKSGGREELAEKELAEIAFINEYLPQEISTEALLLMVKESISESGAVSRKDMGRVMQILKDKTQGRADGRVLSNLVMQELDRTASIG